MLDFIVSNVIGFISVLPLLIAGTSYALFFVSFASIAVHSLGNKRRKKDENDALSTTMSTLADSNNEKDLLVYKIPHQSALRNPHQDLFSKIGVIQDDTILHICSYLTPKSITNLACVNKATNQLVDDHTQKLGHAVWQSLWFRDYGKVLLRWETSRDAIWNSLTLGEGSSNADTTSTLASSSENLANMVVNALKLMNTKQFYFRFQLAFVDYVLAGHNSETKCLMGIHGHIFDFTDFAPNHPGLSEPILLECGKDVTHFFEDIRHSKGARRIAQRLCLIVDQSRLNNDSSKNDIPCGLYCPPQKTKNLIQFLRETNTRPPTADESQPPVLRIENLLPSTHRPTLGSQLRIRTLKQYLKMHEKERNQLPATKPVLDKAAMRLYYDPFLGKWRGWHTDRESRPVFSNLSTLDHSTNI